MVLYVGLLDISIRQTLTEGLPKTLVSLSLQGRAQAGGAVVWGRLVPTLGEGWFTQCGQWDLMGSTWLQEWSFRINSSVRVVHLQHWHCAT